MEFIMKIGDTMILPSIGYVISGSNNKITKNDLSMLNLKNKYIMVKTATNEIIFKVLEVKISFSIVDKLIIGINVEESDDFSKIKKGDLLYGIDRSKEYDIL